MSVAHNRYGLDLRKIKTMISDETMAAADEALSSVALLSHYESIIGSFVHETLFSDGFRHVDGAKAMLCIRRSSLGSRTPMDKHIRRLIVSQLAYRSIAIPP